MRTGHEFLLCLGGATTSRGRGLVLELPIPAALPLAIQEREEAISGG